MTHKFWHIIFKFNIRSVFLMTLKFSFDDLLDAWEDFLHKFVNVEFYPFRYPTLRQAGVSIIDEKIPHIYLMKALKSGNELPKIRLNDESEFVGIIYLHSPTLVYEARIKKDCSVYIFTLDTFNYQSREKWQHLIQTWLIESIIPIRQQLRCNIIKNMLYQKVFRPKNND